MTDFYQASDLVGKPLNELRELLETYNTMAMDDKLDAKTRKQAEDQANLISREMGLRYFSEKPNPTSTVFTLKDKTGIHGLKKQITITRNGRGAQ